MKSVNELLKEHRKKVFIPVNENSSGLTADLDEAFIKELLNDELLSKLNGSDFHEESK